MKTSLQTHRRKAISPIIATILVVAMTIVAAGVLYTYFTTTASRAQSTDQIQVSASIAVASGSGTGTAVVSVTDSGSIALTGLTLGGSIAPASVTWTPGFTTPIPPGGGTSTTFSTASSVTAGVSYTITVAATFANGATQTQVVTITAQ